MSDVIKVRIFCLGMLALATYLLWIPLESGLQIKQGHVASAHDYLGGRKDATLAFDDGSTASCHARALSSRVCPIAQLKILASTKEKLTAKVRKGKIYDIETANGTKLVAYSKVRSHGLMLLLLIDGILVLMGVFAPQLIRPRY